MFFTFIYKNSLIIYFVLLVKLNEDNGLFSYIYVRIHCLSSSYYYLKNRNLFGSRMCFLRWWCLCDVCFGTDCLLKTIYSGEVFLTMILGCAWQGVTLLNRLLIYFCIVIFFVLFGT